MFYFASDSNLAHNCLTTPARTRTFSVVHPRKAIPRVSKRTVLVALAVVAFLPVLMLSLQAPAPSAAVEGLVAGDVAWMLTATGWCC